MVVAIILQQWWGSNFESVFHLAKTKPDDLSQKQTNLFRSFHAARKISGSTSARRGSQKKETPSGRIQDIQRPEGSSAQRNLDQLEKDVAGLVREAMPFNRIIVPSVFLSCWGLNKIECQDIFCQFRFWRVDLRIRSKVNKTANLSRL